MSEQMFEWIGKEALCDRNNKIVKIEKVVVRTGLYSKRGKLLFAPVVDASSEKEAVEETLREAEKYVQLRRIRRHWKEVKILSLIYVTCPLCTSHAIKSFLEV